LASGKEIIYHSSNHFASHLVFYFRNTGYYTVKSPERHRGKNWYEMIHQIDWSDEENLKGLQRGLSQGHVEGECETSFTEEVSILLHLCYN